MLKYVITGIVLIAIAVGVYLFFGKKKSGSIPADNAADLLIVQSGRVIPLGQDASGNELSIRMDMLPAEEFEYETSLVEIKNSTVLARIDNLIPGMAQVGVAAANAVRTGGETLYRAIIPAGTKLTNSKAMEGAVRGFYRGADGIQGHANLVAVNQTATTVANTAAAAMGVVSMVVGQYYMTQINAEIGEISDGIEKIASFQNNEFKSRVFALVTQVKKITSFQIEILDNEDLRSGETTHLNGLEDECIQLLGQANLMISDFSKKQELDYEAYEKELQSAQNWYVFQQTLLDVLYKLADMKYALYFGKVSREQCAALLPAYTRQVSDAQDMLADWHEANMKKLGVDVSETKRRRTGIDGAIHWIPGLFDEKHHYRPISKRTADMIGAQISGQESIHRRQIQDLYSEDVQIISKGGKLYYLSPENAAGVQQEGACL